MILSRNASPLPHSELLRQLGQQNGAWQLQQQVELDIENIKDVLKESKEMGRQNQQINIAVNLGKNVSYQGVNNSQIRVYQHNNTMPNFFITINESLNDARTKKTKLSMLNQILDNIDGLKQGYFEASQVLLYQHEPGGYAARDCLKSIAFANNITIGPPLTAEYREDWEILTKTKKNSFHFLFGGLSFGVCESINHPCTYFAMLRNPLERIITIYFTCKNEPLSPYCQFSNLNVSSMDLKAFIKSQGSSLFQKLLYYSRHCKPVGEDEICIQDTKTVFVLSQRERKVYLAHVLKNLDKWFSVIGLVDRMGDSLRLFEEVLGHKFSRCLEYQIGQEHLEKLKNKNDYVLPYVVKSLKTSLLKDREITKVMYADLVIFNRLQEIFETQIESYRKLKSLREQALDE